MVILTMGLLATTVAMGQPYDGQHYMGDGFGGHAHPWAPADPRQALPRAFHPALWASQGVSSTAASGDAGVPPRPASFSRPDHGPGPFHAPFPEGLASSAGGGALTYIDSDPRFHSWTPEFPGAPNPLNTRSGGNPGMGFWEVAPTAFRYRRVPVTGGPAIYAHGWYTPWGDYEGMMIIRGNARGMFNGYGYGALVGVSGSA